MASTEGGGRSLAVSGLLLTGVVISIARPVSVLLALLPPSHGIQDP